MEKQVYHSVDYIFSDVETETSKVSNDNAAPVPKVVHFDDIKNIVDWNKKYTHSDELEDL